jgi:flavin-dependent dehydrogenase
MDVEVAIVGGGPAGAACALLLARAGLRVALADYRPEGAFRVGEGLPPPAKSLLHRLGLWPAFCADAHRESPGNLSWWGSDEAVTQDFVLGVAGCGYQLDRARFDAMLLGAAREAGVTVWSGRRMQLRAAAAHSEPHHMQVDAAGTGAPLTAPLTLRAEWLVDAGGRAASVARRLGAQRCAHESLLAFYAEAEPPAQGQSLASAADADGRSMVEAVAEGWWYSVLLPSGRRLFTFFTDADSPARRMAMAADGFVRLLHDAPNLGALFRRHGYHIQRAPEGRDASGGCLNRVAGPAWLATGDAAISFDPLSSQGIANALDTGIAAAETILAARAGQAGALHAYAQRLARVYAAYLLHRRYFYGLETRLQALPFWQRRALLPVQGENPGRRV